VSDRGPARIAPSTVLVVASLGAFLAFLDATIVNVAFPSIRTSFPDSSIGSLSWVLNAYNIVFAAFLVVCGRLADLIGRRRSYVVGIALFTLASCWCAAAPNVELLVAGRVLQALGSAMLVPASLALVVEAFPESRRSHAIGLWGATAAVAAGLGPPIGGALVQLGDWRWAFLVNLPFGVVSLVAARRGLVESRSPGRRTLPDIPGALLLAAALALLNLAIIKAPNWGWGSPRVLGALALTALLGATFARSTAHHRAPVVDPALVRIPAFRVASLATVLAGGGFYAYLLTNILWLQYVWDYGVLRAGLALVPGAVVAAVVAARLGPLAERVGYRVLVVPGALVWAGAYLWYDQRVGLTPAFWTEWLPGQVLSGIGVGATLPLLASAALAAVPGGRYASASALISSARQLGGVLGVSVLVLIVATPTPATIVGALRDGWLLSIGAFLATALVALLLARPQAADLAVDEQAARPLVLPAETMPEPAGEAKRPVIGLDSIPLLEGLPEETLAELTAASRTVTVPAGEWLFEQGDPAGSAYVVASGRLQIVQDGALVRELTPGTVVGELALLTGEPRSAGARAHRDATLLELPRAAFDAVIDSDPRAGRTLLVQIAEQLRTSSTNGRYQPEPVAPRVVAVVGAHPGSAAADVGAVLVARLARHLATVDPGRPDAAGLARVERDHDRVVLVADGVPDERDGSGDAEWRAFCLRQADLVVLVSRSDARVPADGVAGLAGSPEVVLVGSRPAPERMSEWVATNGARQLTVVAGDLDVGLRALADRIAARSLGLVLAGGGARAFAHVGVLLELEEAGYRVDRLAGTSVGAIVAAQYAVGRDAAELEEVLYREFVRRRPFSDWTLPRHSLARGTRTRSGLVRTLGGDTVLDGLPRQLQVVSTCLLSRSRQVHRSGHLADAVAASCRLPILFPPMPTADGKLLIDGGVLDNLPVDVLMERQEGPVVAVNISMSGGSGRSGGRTGPPRIPPLGDTLFRTMMIGAGGAVQAAHERGALVVTPRSMGVGLLEFHQFDVMVQAGREAARALLDSGLLASGPDVTEATHDKIARNEGIHGEPALP
jgi:EmrB/QacA subfamily drug resistance transporter